MSNRKIWTMGYFPFQMGGNPNRPISTEVETIEEQPIGKGFTAFSFKTPKGTIKICDGLTGGIIADSFKEAKENVSRATKKLLTDQMRDVKKILKNGYIKHMTNKEFFKLYKF